MSDKGFSCHDISDEHKQCLISWMEYKKIKEKYFCFISNFGPT